MDLKRREFLKRVASIGIGTTLAGKSIFALEGQPLRSPTQQVELGKTGIKVSLVGLGTGMRGWMRQSNHTRMGFPAFERLVKHAYERGINFFDTADLYGTHPFLRDALKSIPREKYVIQTKIWFMPQGLPEMVTDAKAAVDRFRKELDTDYIDIVLFHCTMSGKWTDELRRMMDDLEELKQRGIIKAHGTSSHSIAALKASLASDWVDVQLARINHIGSRMDGMPEDVVPILKAMQEKGKGVVGMKIFGEGTFREPSQREASLRFVLTQRCVQAFVIGFEKPEQIDETLKMVESILKEQTGS